MERPGYEFGVKHYPEQLSQSRDSAMWDWQPLHAEQFLQLQLGYQGQPPSAHSKRTGAVRYLWNEGVTKKSHAILKHGTPMSSTHLKNMGHFFARREWNNPPIHISESCSEICFLWTAEVCGNFHKRRRFATLFLARVLCFPLLCLTGLSCCLLQSWLYFMLL